MSRPTILVTGATGLQGGSVARHLLGDGKYNVRALTRNVNSDKARNLRQAGAEVVAGDMTDRASLRAALSGCEATFGVTNFFEHFGGELQQGITYIDTVAEMKVPQLIFSTLPPANKMSGGKNPVPHLDIKAQIEQHARDLKLNAVYLSLSFYFENFINYQMLQRQPDGTLAFGFPLGDSSLSGFAIDDLGGVVAAVLDRFDELSRKTIGVVGEDAPSQHYAEVFTRVLGRTTVYQYIPRDVYAKLPVDGAEEIANMFEFFRLYLPERKADMKQCRQIYPAMQGFETWLKANTAMFQPLLTTAAAS